MTATGTGSRPIPILKTRDLLIKGRWRDGDVILSALLQEPLKEVA